MLFDGILGGIFESEVILIQTQFIYWCMPDFLVHIGDWAGVVKYGLVFVAAFFEGPVVMMTAGFLFHLRQLKFLPMYAALVGGDFAADIMWYGVGYLGARNIIVKYGKFFKMTPQTIDFLEKKFKKHESKVLFISKLTMGLGLAVPILIVAGMLRVSFKKYIIFNLLGGLLWTLFLVIVGSIFGNVYNLIPESFKTVAVVGIIILFFTLAATLKRYLMKYENFNL